MNTKNKFTNNSKTGQLILGLAMASKPIANIALPSNSELMRTCSSVNLPVTVVPQMRFKTVHRETLDQRRRKVYPRVM